MIDLKKLLKRKRSKEFELKTDKEALLAGLLLCVTAPTEAHFEMSRDAVFLGAERMEETDIQEVQRFAEVALHFLSHRDF